MPLEVKVIIELPGIPEAINSLATALSYRPNDEHVECATAAPDSSAGYPTTVPVETSVDDTPEVDSTPDQPEAVNYSFDQISNAGAALCNQGKTDQLIALLNETYGVQSIVDLDPSRYNALAEDLIRLGAKL